MNFVKSVFYRNQISENCNTIDEKIKILKKNNKELENPAPQDVGTMDEFILDEITESTESSKQIVNNKFIRSAFHIYRSVKL